MLIVYLNDISNPAFYYRYMAWTVMVTTWSDNYIEKVGRQVQIQAGAHLARTPLK